MTAKKKRTGQPSPRWPVFMQEASARIAQRKGWTGFDAVVQIAAEIVAHGDGPKFLCAVRRGRCTQRQNLRYQLLREVENLIGAGVPRRREDRNTPESARWREARGGIFQDFIRAL